MTDFSFTSRRFFKTYSIRLLKTGLAIHKKTLFESLEYEIPYDRIKTKKNIATKIGFGLLV